MLGPHELLDEIVKYGNIQYDKGSQIIDKNDLWKYVLKIDPSARKESLSEIIRELDARGWLLENDEYKIKFDPASFQ